MYDVFYHFIIQLYFPPFPIAPSHLFKSFCPVIIPTFLVSTHLCRSGSPPLGAPPGGSRGETPLYYAACFGHATAVEVLLHAKADVNAASNLGPEPQGGSRVPLVLPRVGGIFWEDRGKGRKGVEVCFLKEHVLS